VLKITQRDDAIPVIQPMTRTKFNTFFNKLKNLDFEAYASDELLGEQMDYRFARNNVYFVFEADYNWRKILGSNASPDVEITINEQSVEVINRDRHSCSLKVILSA
jgi:hypothetical protein